MQTLDPFVGPSEESIPMPASKRGNGMLGARMERLGLGASFKTRYTRQACYQMARRLGVKVNIREVPGEIDMIRVWRIE